MNVCCGWVVAGFVVHGAGCGLRGRFI